MWRKLRSLICTLSSEHGTHDWVVLGTRLRCKRCNLGHTPAEEDVKIYPGRYVTGHDGSDHCGEGNHQWETTRQVVSVEQGGYIEDFICKQCGEIERNVKPHEKKWRLGQE